MCVIKSKEGEMFWVPLNPDHRVTAEELFINNERKEEAGRK